MKRMLAIITVIACLLVCAFPMSVTNALADEVTVSGTVDSDSTGNILKLNTSNGTMDLKIDSNTNFNNVRSLLPGQNLTVKITYGSDAYWHVASIEAGASSFGVKVDRENASTVTGQITGVAASDVIKFKLQNGEEMLIKVDSETDYSGTQFLMVGRNYSIRVGYGSDAYMHAVSIADGVGSSATVVGSSYITPVTNVSASTTVSGSVGDKSTSSILHLNTDNGEMQIKLDAISKAYVLYHGQKIKVNIGYADGYWHAVSIQE